MTGDELRALRRRLKLTQAELGDVLGLNRTTVLRYERGGQVPAWLAMACRRLEEQSSLDREPTVRLSLLGSPPAVVYQTLGRHLGELSALVVLGFRNDGTMYTDTSAGDGGTVIWLMERARHRIMREGDALEEGR